MYRFIGLYLVLYILYAYVGYSSFGYDDEFFNIHLIEKFGLRAWEVTQGIDVHPPGSYLMDGIFYYLLRDWAWVRTAISLCTATVLIVTLEQVRKKKGELSGGVCFILLGLNPAILLWCTSLRWYAFFVPLLLWLCLLPEQKKGWAYWGRCFGGLLGLGFISYAVFMVFFPLVVLYWNASIELRREKIKKVVVGVLLWCIVYLHQFFVFLTVHWPHKEKQTFGILKNLIGFFSAQISNQGVFPLSLMGIIAMLGTLGLASSVLYSHLKGYVKNPYLPSYGLASVFFLFSGLAGKMRNLVVLSPLQALWLCSPPPAEKGRKVFLFFLSLIAVAHLGGVYQVLTHQNTTKNSWNLPMHAVLKELSQQQVTCGGQLLILTHDPMFSFYLQRQGFQHLGAYAIEAEERLHRRYECLIVLKTYAGSIPEKQYQQLFEDVEKIQYRRVETMYYAQDPFYSLKKKLDSRYPEYMVEMRKYESVEHLEHLKTWLAIEG